MPPDTPKVREHIDWALFHFYSDAPGYKNGAGDPGKNY